MACDLSVVSFRNMRCTKKNKQEMVVSSASRRVKTCMQKQPRNAGRRLAPAHVEGVMDSKGPVGNV